MTPLVCPLPCMKNGTPLSHDTAWGIFCSPNCFVAVFGFLFHSFKTWTRNRMQLGAYIGAKEQGMKFWAWSVQLGIWDWHHSPSRQVITSVALWQLLHANYYAAAHTKHASPYEKCPWVAAGCSHVLLAWSSCPVVTCSSAVWWPVTPMPAQPCALQCQRKCWHPDIPVSPRDEELADCRIWYRKGGNDGGRRQIGLFDTKSGLFACFRVILSPASKSWLGFHCQRSVLPIKWRVIISFSSTVCWVLTSLKNWTASLGSWEQWYMSSFSRVSF